MTKIIIKKKKKNKQTLSQHWQMNSKQGFRSGRSCTDAVFVLRQIVERSIEYNKSAYLCFIDLQKAFDRIWVEDVIYLLHN